MLLNPYYSVGALVLCNDALIDLKQHTFGLTELMLENILSFEN